MNTITINPRLYHSAEMFAEEQNVSIRELVESILEKAFSGTSTTSTASWRDYKVSPEVMEMTFKERKEIPADYKEEYFKAIKEKLL